MDTENTKFCIHCGGKIALQAVVCPLCGCQVEQMPTVVIQNVAEPGRRKDKWLAVILCFFLGYLGVHRFYEGKIGTGILWLLTLGLFGLGVLIDFIILLCKSDPYYVK